MIELRLEVDRPWTVRFEDTEGRLRLHRERAALLRELVATFGLVVRDWGETLADYPRESVTVEIEAPSDEAVREVVRTAVRWLRNGAVKDIRIGVAGQAPVNAAAIDLAGLPSGAQANGGAGAAPMEARPPAPAPAAAAPAPEAAAPAAAAPAPEAAAPVPAAARPSTAAEARPPGWTSARPPDHYPDLYAGPPPASVMSPPSRGLGRAAPIGLVGGIVGGIVRGIRGLRPSGDLRHAEAAAEPAGGAAHVAYGLLRGPAEVVALEPFDLEVGLSKVPAAGVAGPALNLPPVEAEPYDVDVRIAASGFTFPPDQPQRLTLKVSAAHPYPVVNVRLIPKRPREGAVDRHITAEYSIGGERLGDAIRSIRVLPTSDLRTRPVAERVETGVNVLAPTGTEKADLTLTVRKADKPGFVDWTIDSPHTDVVTPNRKPITTELEDAGDYLRNLIQQIDAAEGSEGVFDDVLALAYRVGRSVPDEVWKAIRAVAARRGGPPTILLVSEEAYIPWELAQVDPPLLPGSTLPPFLAAQSRIGRWVQATRRSTAARARRRTRRAGRTSPHWVSCGATTRGPPGPTSPTRRRRPRSSRRCTAARRSSRRTGPCTTCCAARRRPTSSTSPCTAATTRRTPAPRAASS